MHAIFAVLLEHFHPVSDLRRDAEQFLCLHGCDETAAHSIRVANEARRLAERFKIDPTAAESAALLHDISAIYPNHQRVEVARELGLDVLPEEERFPLIIHQKISKAMARDVFSVHDQAVLEAIECHTTLKANSTPTDLVLFVADKIEWDQTGTPPYLERLLKELDKSLEHAAFAYLSHLWEQREKLRVVHPWLKEAYEELAVKLAHSS